jgi:hypothetical protein
MAITVSGTTVTFNDGTVQSTEATLLGAVQFTAYSSANMPGQQGFQTTQGIDTNGFVDKDSTLGTFGGGTTFMTGPASATSVICGFQAYRSGLASTGNDSTQDAGVIQRRMVFRSVSGA